MFHQIICFNVVLYDKTCSLEYVDDTRKSSFVKESSYGNGFSNTDITYTMGCIPGWHYDYITNHLLQKVKAGQSMKIVTHGYLYGQQAVLIKCGCKKGCGASFWNTLNLFFSESSHEIISILPVNFKAGKKEGSNKKVYTRYPRNFLIYAILQY